eukprot:GHVU01096220.1.p1 GENE.GHVU01096220.1~~GHVU01096220.1.p1  ORF type:complete len:129 (-),score=7.20 GHVU01096220.1:157-543(-)
MCPHTATNTRVHARDGLLLCPRSTHTHTPCAQRIAERWGCLPAWRQGSWRPRTGRKRGREEERKRGKEGGKEVGEPESMAAVGRFALAAPTVVGVAFTMPTMVTKSPGMQQSTREPCSCEREHARTHT